MPAADGLRLRALVATPGADFLRALDEAWKDGDAVLPLDPQAPASVRAATVTAMRTDVRVPAGTALVIATSGSTATPKGALLSHRALAASAAATARRLGAQPDDHWLSCLPWHHIGGLQVPLRARAAGVPLTAHERFDVERIRADRTATLISLVPTQLVRLLDAGVDLSRFRAILLGGAAAPPALLDRARAGRARVVTTYGMTETCGGCVYDGAPLDGVEVRLAPTSVGKSRRIELRGPMLLSGYHARPDLDREVLVDGWYRTGDAGEWDGDRLRVLGRLDDVIVTGGENVVAGVVAAALIEHPSVRDAVVVGVPDEQWGQLVVAVVVPDTDAVPSPVELRSWVKQRASAAAAPRRFITVEALPLLGSGKPDLGRLRALAQSGQAAPTRSASSQSAEPPSVA